MSSQNVRNVAPSPAIPINLTPKSGATVQPYDQKRLAQHVLLRFQPTHIMTVPKSAYTAEQVQQLEQWWAGLKIDLRPSPFFPTPNGVAFLWTFCGGDDADFDAGLYGDDCE
jgi:hypothetical protein